MRYFDVDSYQHLESAIKKAAISGDMDAKEDLQYLKKAILTFADYVREVEAEQIETKFAKGLLKGEEYQRVVSHFDGTRHTAHELANINTRMVNRLADAYKVGHVFLGDPDNRREIGHFCGEIAFWLFDNRYT